MEHHQHRGSDSRADTIHPPANPTKGRLTKRFKAAGLAIHHDYEEGALNFAPKPLAEAIAWFEKEPS
jgi:hypothetical protein